MKDEGGGKTSPGIGRETYLRFGYTALRCLLAAVFLFAGAMKARGPQRFAVDIESYRIVPAAVAMATAYYLPWLEIACGAALLVRRTAPGGTLVAGGLTALFTLALLSAWARGLEIRCGCFGGNDAPAADYTRWLLRDLALLIGGVLLWRRQVRESGLQRFLGGYSWQV